MLNALLECINKIDYDQLVALYNSNKHIRYTTQYDANEIDIHKDKKDELIKIGYERALLDVMQSCIEHETKRNEMKKICTNKCQKSMINLLFKEGTMVQKDLLLELGISEKDMALMVNEINAKTTMINVTQLGDITLYSLTADAYHQYKKYQNNMA